MSSAQAQFASDVLNGRPDYRKKDDGFAPVIVTGSDKTAMESLDCSVQTAHGVSYELDLSNKLRPRVNVKCSDMDWEADWKKRKEQNLKLLLSTKDNVVFRLYITEMTLYDHPTYQRRLCKFLRCLSDSQTVHIHLGCGCYDRYPVYTVGCVIDAIQRCRGTVITHLNGRASFSETCIWLTGHQRVFSEFTTISFVGLQQFLKYTPEWAAFFELFLSRAVDLKILTKEEKDTIMTSNKTVNLSYRDIVDRLAAKSDADDNDTIQPE